MLILLESIRGRDGINQEDRCRTWAKPLRQAQIELCRRSRPSREPSLSAAPSRSASPCASVAPARAPSSSELSGVVSVSSVRMPRVSGTSGVTARCLVKYSNGAVLGSIRSPGKLLGAAMVFAIMPDCSSRLLAHLCLLCLLLIFTTGSWVARAIFSVVLVIASRLCCVLVIFERSIIESSETEINAGLVEYVEMTVESEISRSPGRPVYLLGESVGACIALSVAARNRDTDLVLILVNPGTSYHKSQLQSLAGFLDFVPEPFHFSTPQFLNFLTGNMMKMPSTFIGRGIYLEQGGQVLSEMVTSLRLSLQLFFDILPRETIVWKLEMLRTASSFVNSRLRAVKAQTLVLASGYDELLPSHEEAQRLRSMLENCRIRYFRDKGHTLLMEGGFDLVTTIKGAGYYRRSRQTDFVSDYLPPTPNELEKVIDSLRILNFATDPVVLSTLPDGKIVRGLAGLPREGPAVLVGNHMLMGLESVPMVAGVLRSTGINFRGLAHPFLFDKKTEQLMPDSSLFDVYRILGAVPVTSLNFYKLLLEKHFVLLYPGGAREALHRKGEEYKLFWPEQPEFVRMASRFKATIIPFGVVGEDDICDRLAHSFINTIFRVYKLFDATRTTLLDVHHIPVQYGYYNVIQLDYNDLLKLPFYDIIYKELNKYSMKLREDSLGKVKDQGMHPILVSPKVPGRSYFIFGKPIETRGREKELRGKESAQHLYLHVKSEAESYIKYLKEKREEDPYRSILSRLLYQAVNGRNAEIPTFEP